MLSTRHPPVAALFPSTTLFRSGPRALAHLVEAFLDVHAGPAGVVVAGARARYDDTCGSEDRKSTRLNSSHLGTSYAVFCSKKKRRWESHGRMAWSRRCRLRRRR